MNEALLDFVNGAAGRSELLDAVGRFAATDLIFVLGPVLFGFTEWRRNPKRSIQLR